MLLANRVVKRCSVALTVLCGCLGSLPAIAASLGELDVKSKLYESFEARIALREVKEGELDSLRVALASDTTFERFGLLRSMVLSTLTFKVVATTAGRGYVQVSSHERVREPVLSFVLEATFAGAPGTTLQRRYDVLLDLN